ncbi:MAG TPA: hypothetical protein VLT86_12735, partial [Vicinamibacterales bacterium]|nr:hypothetical protein [Vicinamibacterales bacterium]
RFFGGRSADFRARVEDLAACRGLAARRVRGFEARRPTGLAARFFVDRLVRRVLGRRFLLGIAVTPCGRLTYIR